MSPLINKLSLISLAVKRFFQPKRSHDTVKSLLQAGWHFYIHYHGSEEGRVAVCLQKSYPWDVVIFLHHYSWYWKYILFQDGAFVIQDDANTLEECLEKMTESIHQSEIFLHSS